MAFQLKKKRLDATLANLENPLPAEVEDSATEQAAKGATDADDPEGKVRLSCDIKRKNHKKLRLAAADRYTTHAQVVDDLIERNL